MFISGILVVIGVGVKFCIWVDMRGKARVRGRGVSRFCVCRIFRNFWIMGIGRV